MRILYLLHTIDNLGGTELHTKTLSKEVSKFAETWIVGLSSNGVVIESKGERTEIPCELPSFPKTPYQFAPLERVLKDVIEHIKPDVIHIQHFLRWHFGALDQLIATKLPVFLTLHDYFLFSPAFTYLAGSFDEYLKNSSKIFGTDEKEYLTDRFKKLSNSLQRLNQLIVPSAFCERVFAKVRYPQIVEHGITPFEISGKGENIGFVGSFLPQKGSEVILKLGAKRDPLLPPILVYGSDGEAAGLKFMGPFNESDRGRIFSDLKAVIIPSLFHETYSLLLSEAWFAGVFPIVSDIGALGERVNGAGIKCTPGDVGSFEKALNQIDEGFSPQKVRLATEMAAEYLTIYG